MTNGRGRDHGRSKSLAGVLAGGLAFLCLHAEAGVPRTPSNFCIEGANKCAPGANSDVKWHPGHYIIEDVLDVYNPNHTKELKALGGAVQGIALWVSWRELEPTRGNYDFSLVKSTLDTLQAAGLHVIVQIQDRSFSGKNVRTPDYLTSEPGADGGIYQKGSGSSSLRGTLPKVWNPVVMGRWIALLTALSNAFDTHPAFEGIRGEETDVAFSTDEYAAADFDPNVYLAQLLRLNSAMAGLFPHSNKWIGANFLDSQAHFETLIKDAWAKGLGVMSSDLVPGKQSWAERIYTGQHWNGSAWTTEGGHDYRGEAVYEAQIQSPEMGGKAGNFTPAQFYADAQSLEMHHMAWERKNYAWDASKYGIAAGSQTYWDSAQAGNEGLRIKSWLSSGNRSLIQKVPSTYALKE